MRAWWSQVRPYVSAVLGVAAITAAIGLLRPWVDLPNLVVAYLLLVLWLSARYGWLPAVSAAILAFVSYDWFLVPPYGTLYISAARDLLNLVVLVVAALAGGRLAATLAAREAGAIASARESGILSEVASTALREATPGPALSLLCDRAVSAAGLESMTLLAGNEGELETVAGAPATEAERTVAGGALAAGTNVGVRLRGGRLELQRTSVSGEAVHVVLTGGVAILRPRPAGLDLEHQRLLAALLGLAGLLLDRRLAAVVSERARELETSDRMKAAILSSISHELKSPLASLRAGLTTMLMPEARLRDDDQRELLMGLDRQATRLDRLVGDLLTMSRLEAGIAPMLQPQDLQGLSGAVLAGLDPVLGGFEVVATMPDDLPPALADELQLERVLTNLLGNAAEWTSPGGRITIGARHRGDELEVWVENEGPAIPTADLEQIFDKFWTRREGGSGLGLAICRRIVEAHGGTISAVNRAAGPRFRFTLPLAPAPAEAVSGR